MPRSTRNSDDDFEPKTTTGRMQTRMLDVKSVSSPLRRSSRLKQNKYSPGSESDSSNSNSHVAQSAKIQTDSTATNTLKKQYSRWHSALSDISDIETSQSPRKRNARQSSNTSINTPTRTNTRASKRNIRAVSEIQSPISTVRLTRSTRANSAEPESMFNQKKDQIDSPIRTRKRLSMTEFEERIPYVRLDATIIETDEVTSSGNSDSSPNKYLLQNQKIYKKCRSIDKSKIEDYHEKIEISSGDSSKDDIIQSLKKQDQTQAEDMAGAVAKDTLAEGQCKLEKTQSSDNNTIDETSVSYISPDHQHSVEEKKIEILKEIASDVEELVDVHELITISENASENLLETSTEEQKSDKENEKLNINSDASLGKNAKLNVYTSPLMNKSLNEKKEIKSVEKKLNKKNRSKESTEITIEYDSLLKEVADNSQIETEKNTSTEFSNLTTTNETVLSSCEKIMDTIVNNETSIENENTSDIDAEKVTNESKEMDKEKNTGNINFSKIVSDKTNKMSPITSTESLHIEEKNEIKLILDESPSKNENEISSNRMYSKLDQSVQLISSTDESFEDQTVQNKVIESLDSAKERQEQNKLSEHATESILESSAVTSDNSICNDANQSSNIIETKNSKIDISYEKINAKDMPENVAKQNLNWQSSDVSDDIEIEDKSLEMKTNEKSRDNLEVTTDSDVDGINLFQNIPVDEWKEKNKLINIDSVQLVEETENDNETECDLILMDKQAWLTAKSLDAAEETEPFEYDSDDTVLLKRKFDAAQANYDVKKLDINKEPAIDNDIEENEERFRKRRSRTKRRLTSEIDQDSSRHSAEQKDEATPDKSFIKSKTTLDQIDNEPVSKSESVKTNKSYRENDEEIEDDTNKLNKSQKNKSLQKIMEKRASLNCSKDAIQNVSGNKSRINDSEEKSLDTTDTHMAKELRKKESSSKKIHNKYADHSATEAEKEDSDKEDENTSSNHSMDQESKQDNTKMIHLNDDEDCDSSDVNLPDMDIQGKICSMIMNTSSSDDQDECDIPSYLFAKANTNDDSDENNSDSDENNSDSDENNSNSDINKEYNLDGVKLKFSDDDVAADECRTSEIESSDSNDNGSDLADFIVDDDSDDTETEKGEKKDDDNDDGDENLNVTKKRDDEVEELKDEDEQSSIDEELLILKNTDKNDESSDYASDKEISAKEVPITSNALSESYKSEIDYIPSNKIEKIKKIKKVSYSAFSPDLLKLLNEASCSKSTLSKRKSRRTMYDIGAESPTIKFLRKEKLNESAPTLQSNTKTSLLKMDTKKDSSQIKEQINKTGMSDDGTIPFLSKETNKKKHKKRNKQEILKENIIDETLSEDTIELNAHKKKKIKLAQLNIIDDNVRKDAYQITEKKKKKKKQDTVKENSIDEASFKDSVELKMRKKKKKLFEPTESNIIDDSTHEETCQNREKRKRKRRDVSKENIVNEILPKDAIELDNHKKKKIKLSKLNIVDNNTHEEACHSKEKKKKKKQDSVKENSTDEASFKDSVELKMRKKKKLFEPTESNIIDDSAHEETCQNREKRKRKRQDVSKENIVNEILPKDAIELDIHKKKKIKLSKLNIVDDNIREEACHSKEKKKKKQDTSKENIVDEVSSKDSIELKVPKKKKSVKFVDSVTFCDNINYDETGLINKKKKKQDISKKNVTACDEILFEETKISKKKKKHALLNQSSILEDSIDENMKINENQIEKKKKKKPKISKKNIIEEMVELIFEKDNDGQPSQSIIMEDNTCKNEREKKKKKREKENAIEKILSDDLDLKSSKKKKCANLNQLVNIQSDTHKNAYQNNKKEKKKQKINITEDENPKKDNVLGKNSHGNETEFLQQKKKKSSLKLNANKNVKNIEQQKIKESSKSLQTEKKKNVLIPISKFKSDKHLLSHKQKAPLQTSESKNITHFNKKLHDNVSAKICISKELKTKKKRDQVKDIDTKKLKKDKFLPSSSSLKRLSEDVIENLADVPIIPKKRRILERNERAIKSKGKSKVTTVDDDSLNTLDTSTSTQFQVINLQNVKSSKASAAATSFRQRMLTRNSREPMSAYLMYREKLSKIMK